MEDSMKIKFNGEDDFTVYYISKNIFDSLEYVKIFFKMLNLELKDRFNYEFHGFYQVLVYYDSNFCVFDFKYIDEFSKSDFDITVFLNSTILYEFDDIDLVSEDKIYYKNKFYTEIENVIDNIYLYEYGNIVYSDMVDNILNNGILIKKTKDNL